MRGNFGEGSITSMRVVYQKKTEHRPSGFVNVVFFTILDSFHNISAFFTMSHCEKLQNIAKNEQHCEKYNIDKTRRAVL